MVWDLFAYGSNMHERDLWAWFEVRGPAEPRCEVLGAAVLPNWRLVFNLPSVRRGGGVANVEPVRGEAVHGVVLRVDEPTLGSIDAKERSYHRVPVKLVGPVAEAEVYVADPDRTAGHIPPTEHYLGLILEAGRQYGFPAGYMRRLRAARAAQE